MKPQVVSLITKALSLAMMVTVGVWYAGLTHSAQAQEHRDRAKFHADVAHALLDMNTTLDLIEAYRAQGAMPPDRDEKHDKAAHGFLKGLKLFGVQTSMR